MKKKACSVRVSDLSVENTLIIAWKYDLPFNIWAKPLFTRKVATPSEAPFVVDEEVLDIFENNIIWI